MKTTKIEVLFYGVFSRKSINNKNEGLEIGLCGNKNMFLLNNWCKSGVF